MTITTIRDLPSIAVQVEVYKRASGGFGGSSLGAPKLAIAEITAMQREQNITGPRTSDLEKFVNLAALQRLAVDSVSTYVFALIDYVSAHSNDPDATSSISREIGQFRRRGLSVNERFDDFIASAQKIVSFLADRPNQPSHDFFGAAPMEKTRDDNAAISVHLKKLSPREITVLELLLKGLPNKQIAYEMGISICTTKAHVGAILRKLRISSRARVISILANLESHAMARFTED
jgi:DNA-binding NarL/FixJ family response regulator